ncbi:MAG TPA: HNH endonuclease [Pyrinomonadaceae bacterium]|jgi:hypothetical protein
MSEHTLWYLRARRRYIWDMKTIDSYLDVLREIVFDIIKDHSEAKYLKKLASPDIGLVILHDDHDGDWGYALYISDTKVHTYKRRSLFSEFKDLYQINVGAGLAGEMLGSEDSIRKRFPPNKAEEIIRRKKLVRDFMTLANKSINHRRRISPRLRFQVFQRDNSTCQVCGRRAPEVILHLDHIEPVSWESNWQPSNHPDDYQVLCEECNLGKGNLSWLLNIS